VIFVATKQGLYIHFWFLSVYGYLAGNGTALVLFLSPVLENNKFIY
jgi:hypothetical protein